MKIQEKLRKLQEKYENYIADKKLWGFTELYMKVMQKLTVEKEENN